MKYVMEVIIEHEAGYKQALQGLALSYKQNKNMHEVALRLASRDFGENKFLESIIVWLRVTAPRYFWQEADTYRLSTKQSESTMHTLIGELRGGIAWDKILEDGTCISPGQVKLIEDALKISDPTERLVRCKQCIPEGFIQTRMWCMSYKTLRNIIIQRQHHRLPHWHAFLSSVYAQLEHTELLP